MSSGTVGRTLRAGIENTAPNLFYLRSGEVVYYTAAAGAAHVESLRLTRVRLKGRAAV